MNNIFISYSRRNVASVERLSRDLQDAGFNVWVDFRRIPGGAHWQEAIFDGIRNADIVIPCLSPDAVNSEWVRREVAFAQELDKRIIPIQLRDVFDVLADYEELRPLLDIQIINFASLGYERAYPILLGVLPGSRHEAETDDPDSIPNPFKGLESFTETDSDIFFGRDDLVQKALDQLQTCVRDPGVHRFLAVVGASGSGKSSVVRAGVVPAIRRGALPGSARFPVITFKPGSEPTATLMQRINPLIEEMTQDELMDMVARSPSGLHEIGGKILETAQGGTYIVLLIDQFEEVFTQTAPLERRAFLDTIYDAVTQPDGYFLVIVTMRADFFDRLSHYNNLASLFEQNNLIIVSEMTADNLRRSIEGPARAVGLEYDQGLPDKILEEVLQQPGSLPLLQYMLTKLYEKRNGAMLTWSAYDEIGGVRKALAQHAEDVYMSIEPAEQDLTKRILLSLVEVDESGVATRRRLRRRDLSFRYMSETALNALLDKLTSPEVRLLVTSRQLQAGDEEQIVWVEVVHEALIREWTRFQNWITENQENLRISTEVLQDAQDWENADRDASYLLTSSRLDRAVLWLQDADATELQRRFILASEEEAERAATLEAERNQYVSSLEERSRQRLRLLVFGLSIFLLVAAGLAVFGWVSAVEATEARRIAESSEAELAANVAVVRSRALAQEAAEVLENNNSQLAVSLGIEANSIASPPPLAQSIFSEAAYRAPRLVLTYDEQDPVYSVTYSVNPDDPNTPPIIYAAGAGRNAIVAWNAETGEQTGDELTAHAATVRAVAAHNASFLVSGDENGEVILWDLPERTIRWRGYHMDPDAPNSAVLDIAMNANGTRLVTAGADGTIRLWNTETGEQLGTFGGPLGHDGAVLSVAFSPEGTRIVSGGTDTRVLLWAANTPEADPRELDRHRSWVQDIQFTRDGNTVISGSSDSSLRIYDIRRNMRVADIDQPDRSVRAVAISPDGSAFAAGTTDNLITLWDINTRAQRHEYTGHINEVYSLAYSPRGDTLLSGGSDGKVILWDAQPGPVIWRAEGDDQRFIDVAFSPDGSTAVGITTAGTLVAVDTATGAQLNKQDITNDTATSIAYSPNGETALVGTLGGDLLVLDPNTWAVVERFSGYYTDAILSLAYSPDGKSAATGGEDGRIILWDIEAETLVRDFNSVQGAIWALTFTPDGRSLIYSFDVDGESGLNVIGISVRNLFQEPSSPNPISSNPDGHTDTIRDLAVSHDGRWLLSASDDGRLILWDIPARSLEDNFEGHGANARILSVAFAPDASYAISADDLGEIILWDIASGQVIRRLNAHTDLVNRVLVHPSGQLALSASADSAMLLWRIYDAQEQITWAVTNRDEQTLSCEDRLRYAVAQPCPETGTPTNTPSPLPPTRAVAFAATPVSPTPPPVTFTPTPSLTPSVTPTPTITPTPTATPAEQAIARIGQNRGQLVAGGTDVWRFEATAGMVLSLEVVADNPARAGADTPRDPNGLDALVQLRTNSGGVLAENDDRVPGVVTNSLIEIYPIEIDGIYEIHVTSWNKQSGGGYTLLIEDLS